MPSIYKYPFENTQLLVGSPVFNNSIKTYSDIFPVGKLGNGETWEKIRLTFYHTIGGVALTFPIADGAYHYIKRVVLENSDGETMVDCPGGGLYWFNYLNDQVAPMHDEITVAPGVYVSILDIPFGMNFLRKPADSYFDSGAYSGLKLTIETGNLADLGVDGQGTTLSVMMDMAIIRTKIGSIDKKETKPLIVPYIKYVGDRSGPGSDRWYDIERASDLALFGFIFAQGTTRIFPFDYTNVATGLHTRVDGVEGVTFGDNLNPRIIDNMMIPDFQANRLQNFRFNDYALLSPLVGIYHYLFIRDGSLYGAYPTGGKSEIKLWATILLQAAPADLLVFGFRTRRKI